MTNLVLWRCSGNDRMHVDGAGGVWCSCNVVMVLGASAMVWVLMVQGWW